MQLVQNQTTTTKELVDSLLKYDIIFDVLEFPTAVSSCGHDEQ